MGAGVSTPESFKQVTFREREKKMRHHMFVPPLENNITFDYDTLQITHEIPETTDGR